VEKTKKPTSMIDEDLEDLDARSLSTIGLCLIDEVLFNIIGEETTTNLWKCCLTSLERRQQQICGSVV
jgi:hypothetical protein